MGVPIGIRNNNPLNIRKSDIAWKGKLTPANNITSFEVFDSPENGIRAAARNLQAYQEKHGLHTLASIIHRWAPPTENDTSAYIASVSIWADIEPNEQLDLSNYETVFPLVRAMCRMENGKPTDGEYWYDDATWEKGLRRAGLTPSKPLINSRTTVGATTAAGGITTAVGILTDLIGMPDNIAELLPTALSSMPESTTAVVVLVIGFIGSVVALYARHDDKLKGRL